MINTRIKVFASGIFRKASLLEDLIVAIALAALMILPITEILFRNLLGIGIDNIHALIQHMTLVVGTIGAAVAVRQKKLLCFSGSKYLFRKWEKYTTFFSNTVSAIICLFLLSASITFLRVESTSGLDLAYDVPLWAIQLVIPIAYAVITIRFIKLPVYSLRAIFLFSILFTTIAAIFFYAPLSELTLRFFLFGILIMAAISGAPVFTIIAGAAMVLLWTEDIPLASIILDHYSLVSNHLLPSIPLFTLAGIILAESNAPKRLIELFDAWFGQLQGGPAIATVLAATFFTCFTGASGVTILALGGLLMPLLISARFTEKNALGLITGGGSAGVLLMPALPLILYAIVANVTIEAMFLGGLLPAMLMLALTTAWGIYIQPKSKDQITKSFCAQRALLSIWNAKWESLLPVILIVAMFSGLMTPLEASALTACYIFIVEVFIHRDISLRHDFLRVFVKCGALVGGILIILGVALGLTNYLVDAQISEYAVEWVQNSIQSPWIFLLALNGFLLVIGFFVDIFSAIIVIAPLIVPMGAAFDIHPVHLGILFLANMELGYLTPPVGMNLFFASTRFEKSIMIVCRSVLPLFFILALGVLIITYVPWLSTGLLFLER